MCEVPPLIRKKAVRAPRGENIENRLDEIGPWEMVSIMGARGLKNNSGSDGAPNQNGDGHEDHTAADVVTAIREIVLQAV